MSKASSGNLVPSDAHSVSARVGHTTKATRSKALEKSDTPPVSLPLPEKSDLPAPSLKAAKLAAFVSEVVDWGKKLNDRKREIERFKLSKSMKRTAIKIAGMRHAGMKSKEIGEILKISPNTVRHYSYLAGKAGIFKPSDYKDDIEFNLSHKIVRNLDIALDSCNPEVARETALELGKHTIFKTFDGPANQAPPAMNVLSIRIENSPTGSPDPIRLGAIGGSPRFLDGETIPNEEAER